MPSPTVVLVTHRVTNDDGLPTVGDGRAPWVTFREAVEGLPLRADGRAWHRPRNPRPESVRRYKAVPRDGGDRFAMQRNLDRAGLGDLVPRCWREKPTGTTDVFGRLWWDRPALTIRTEFYKPEKGRYLHPSAHRPITVREAARLMSFPDDFVLPEDQAMSSIARQVGNAVPPLLARRIAESLAASLQGEAPSRCSLWSPGDQSEQRKRSRPSATLPHRGLDPVRRGGSISSCSQIRTTVQPADASELVRRPRRARGCGPACPARRLRWSAASCRARGRSARSSRRRRRRPWPGRRRGRRGSARPSAAGGRRGSGGRADGARSAVPAPAPCRAAAPATSVR